MTTKASGKLTFHDRLSRLSPGEAGEAGKLLGENGSQLIHRGGRNFGEVDFESDVMLSGDLLRVTFRGAKSDGGHVIATLTTMAESRKRLHWNCDACETACEHVGAVFSLVLEEKTLLGLAEPPAEDLPFELLSETQLLERALNEQAERAKKEKFRLQSVDPRQPWTDYTLTSAATGKTYRVALRGEERGVSYCSCPDFRTNSLGTCKHILYALGRVESKFSADARKKPFRRKGFSVHLFYLGETSLRLALPDKLDEDSRRIVGPIADRPIEDVHDLLKRVRKLEQLGHAVAIYPDAEEFIQQRLFQDRMSQKVAEIRRDPAGHPLRKELLKTELLPYQMDGIAFAVGAGRAILADDMGLGKTIQGVGVAEMLVREAAIRKVLVVCPTSLKSQWRNEIQRFSERDVQLIIGGTAERATQYDNECLFTICNYEQVLRDILAIEKVKWDLIVLDEGQRIKNWESKTARVIKGLRSPYALVLSGTPLENRLDELFSVVQFIDDRRLAPAFRFFHRHRVVDDRGKVLGYRNLDDLRENLRPVLLRRTREMVLKELPPRTTEMVRIPPSDEQLELHNANMQIVSQVVRKAFISEMDLLRMQKALLMCRMSADSTFLVNKQEPSYSTKLARLAELFDGLFAEPDRKAVLFSEWTTMLDLIEPLLAERGLRFVRLDGSVPQGKRQGLVHEFQNDANCKLFLTTNAGSTGLNLQAANTVINVDLPWNPAVLEQRIARAHRMGQKNPVQVFVLITEGTIEENLLKTLANKKDLAMTALDMDSEVTAVDFESGMEELKRRMEVLLGAQAAAPVDESQQQATIEQTEQLAEHRQRVAAAGGEMLGAVFSFLGELVSQDKSAAPSPDVIQNVRSRLDQCVEADDQGRPRLSLTLPNREALDSLAQTLAKLLVAGGK